MDSEWISDRTLTEFGRTVSTGTEVIHGGSRTLMKRNRPASVPQFSDLLGSEEPAQAGVDGWVGPGSLVIDCSSYCPVAACIRY